MSENEPFDEQMPQTHSNSSGEIPITDTQRVAIRALTGCGMSKKAAGTVVAAIISISLVVYSTIKIVNAL